jgi:hypothetical protein
MLWEPSRVSGMGRIASTLGARRLPLRPPCPARVPVPAFPRATAGGPSSGLLEASVPFGVMHLKYLQQWDLACLRSSEGPHACRTCLSFVSRWGQTGTKMNGHWRAAWLKGSGGRGGGGRPWKWQESDGTPEDVRALSGARKNVPGQCCRLRLSGYCHPITRSGDRRQKRGLPLGWVGWSDGRLRLPCSASGL